MVEEWGHRRQEQGSRCRRPAMAGVGAMLWGPGLGGGGVPAVQNEGGRSGVPAAAYYSTREEGTGSAGMLGEESLWAYTCLHHVTSVSPININIGKFHCRVTCQCGPAALQNYKSHHACKTTTPIMLGQVEMMGAVIWQQLQSHTGCAKLLSPYKSAAQPVAL